MAERTYKDDIQAILDLFKETDARLARLFAETDRRFAETDRRFAETDRRFDELRAQIQVMSRRVEDLTGSWGRFVESMVEPALVRLFTKRGIEIEGTALRSKRHRDGEEMEVDLLGVNRKQVVVVEVKTTLKPGDVDDHLTRLARFKEFFPEYADREVIGAVAGMHIEAGADRYAYKNGLFVLGQSGETVRILNDEKFRPRIW